VDAEAAALKRIGRRVQVEPANTAPESVVGSPVTLPARLATTATAAATTEATTTAPAAATAAEATASAAAATTAEAAAATLRGRASFVHRQPATVNFGFIELLDRGARRIFGAHLHEAKAAGTAGGLIAHDAHGFDGTSLAKQVLQRAFLCRERQIADK
jgi:hypothetical protein